MVASGASDVDTSTSKHLRGKYAICGIGETSYRRGSDQTTRSLATWAIKNAMDDAGMNAGDVDGMLSYSGNDSTFSTFVAGDLGIRLNFYMDVHGGGSSTECLIGIAIGVISQIGDLAESKLKRVARVKDSGILIPGHGGLMDRLDSLVLVFPIVYAASRLWD